jgi:mono/diheme cytochrome c family protein
MELPMRVSLFSRALVIAIGLMGTSCKKGSEQDTVPRPPEQIGAPAISTSAGATGESQARVYFKSRCASCHGESGRGDGEGLIALKLKHKPRDHTDPEWQKSVTDDDLRKTILYGGASVGKSPDMPAFGDLQGKGELLEQLVAVIRGFGKT